MHGNEQDILQISDLVSGYEPEGTTGAYLKFDEVARSEDGTTTLKLTLGTESVAVGATVPLATIVMSGSDAEAVDAGSFTRHIFGQLVSHDDIVF